MFSDDDLLVQHASKYSPMHRPKPMRLLVKKGVYHLSFSDVFRGRLNLIDDLNLNACALLAGIESLQNNPTPQHEPKVSSQDLYVHRHRQVPSFITSCQGAFEQVADGASAM